MYIKDNKIAYVVANLKQIGPTNQTLNIIMHSGMKDKCIVITLFKETEDTLIEEYIKNNINVICLNLNRKTFFLSGIKKLNIYLKRNNITVVHSWGTIADMVSYYSCKKLKLKHIITLRNFPVEDLTTRMNKFLGLIIAKLNLYILGKSKYVVACSNSIKKKMQDTYNYNHIMSIQNGVDLDKYSSLNKQQVRNELSIASDETIYISTGSFIPRKRIEETIKAFINLKDLKKKQLWFIGEGILFEKIKEKYSDYPEIKFLGKQKNVTYFLSASDVFVSSSESEGLPNAVLEAIACDTPVFLSDIPQHKEILKELDKCGEEYTLGNINELKQLFENITDKEIEEMSINCSSIKKSNLTMEMMGKKYGEYYESIL